MATYARSAHPWLGPTPSLRAGVAPTCCPHPGGHPCLYLHNANPSNYRLTVLQSGAYEWATHNTTCHTVCQLHCMQQNEGEKLSTKPRCQQAQHEDIRRLLNSTSNTDAKSTNGCKTTKQAVAARLAALVNCLLLPSAGVLLQHCPQQVHPCTSEVLHLARTFVHCEGRLRQTTAHNRHTSSSQRNGSAVPSLEWVPNLSAERGRLRLAFKYCCSSLELAHIPAAGFFHYRCAGCTCLTVLAEAWAG